MHYGRPVRIGTSLRGTHRPGGVTGWGASAWKNQGSTNGAGTQYGLWALGEGPWDGLDTLWNQTSPLFVIGAGYPTSPAALTTPGRRC